MAGKGASRRKSLGRKAIRKALDHAEQTYIPGTEPVRIKEIDQVAADYVNARDDRMAALAEEIEIKPKLLAVMKEHGLTEYSFDGYMVEVQHGEENVKVKKKRAAKEDGSLA